MYKLNYLRIAQQDIASNALYIAEELHDPDAAAQWLEALEHTIVLLREFPYAHSIYPSPLKLPRETRYFPVKNYLVFYVVLEPEKVIEIQRVIYNRMNHSELTRE